MNQLVTLEFYRGSLHFSAGHFTIFSATERERIHGHNYYLEAAMTAEINEPGITFNYQIFRDRLATLCRQLHLYFLLPMHSPYLQITEQQDQYHVIFNNQVLFFPKSDVLLLPLRNITLEELSHWFIEQLSSDTDFIHHYQIHSIIIKCFNGTDHSAKAKWHR
jgi:6-pyruvoyltetrahydropterin/6-carboxytetrahydropterin synthase